MRYLDNIESVMVFFFFLLLCFGQNPIEKSSLTSHHKGKKSVQERSSTETLFKDVKYWPLLLHFHPMQMKRQEGKKQTCICKEKREILPLDVSPTEFSYFSVCLNIFMPFQ